jgi:hypothetical protein
MIEITPIAFGRVFKPLHFEKADYIARNRVGYPSDFSDFAVGILRMPPDLKRCFYQLQRCRKIQRLKCGFCRI